MTKVCCKGDVLFESLKALGLRVIMPGGVVGHCVIMRGGVVGHW